MQFTNWVEAITMPGHIFAGFSYEIQIMDDEVRLIPVQMAEESDELWNIGSMVKKLITLSTNVEDKLKFIFNEWMPIRRNFSSIWVKFNTSAQKYRVDFYPLKQKMQVSDPIQFFNQLNSSCFWMLLLWLGRNYSMNDKIVSFDDTQIDEMLALLHIKDVLWGKDQKATTFIKKKLKEAGTYNHFFNSHNKQLEFLESIPDFPHLKERIAWMREKQTSCKGIIRCCVSNHNFFKYK
jgi:hypothetical protein